MKLLINIIISLLFLNCNQANENISRTILESNKTDLKPQKDHKRIAKKAQEAFLFCENQKMNTDFCILIDMSIHSGLNRFYIWDFNKKQITNEYLVGHGCGINSWSKTDSKDSPKFSNEDGSHLSSLGKYKIGERGYSQWGIHVKYLLHGLEDTNNNALKRIIVLHSWSEMSNSEVYPEGSPEGWGCPTVSNEAMKIIDEKLKNTNKPVLLWIFN